MFEGLEKGPLIRRFAPPSPPKGEGKGVPPLHLSLCGRGRAEGPGEGAFAPIGEL